MVAALDIPRHNTCISTGRLVTGGRLSILRRCGGAIAFIWGLVEVVWKAKLRMWKAEGCKEEGRREGGGVGEDEI